MSNETAIAMGVVSRKLTPMNIFTDPLTLPPTHQEQRKSLPVFFFVFFPLPEFSGKEENYKTRSLCIP